jgi:hypothetical protein
MTDRSKFNRLKKTFTVQKRKGRPPLALVAFMQNTGLAHSFFIAQKQTAQHFGP